MFLFVLVPPPTRNISVCRYACMYIYVRVYMHSVCICTHIHMHMGRVGRFWGGLADMLRMVARRCSRYVWEAFGVCGEVSRQTSRPKANNACIEYLLKGRTNYMFLHWYFKSPMSYVACPFKGPLNSYIAV